MSRRRRRARRLGRVVLLCLLAAALGVGYGYWSVTTPMGKGKAKIVAVAPRESARSVAATLRREGLIRSETTFLALALVTKRYRRMQTGSYELKPTMSAAEILAALCEGTHRAYLWLTIPEGYTLRQIAEATARTKLTTAEDFLAVAREPADLHPSFPLPKTGVEGYLFPDTYRVEADARARQIAGQMLRRFDEVVWKGLFKGHAAYGPRAMHDVITLASLVEAEAKHAEERRVIAGVLMNRLQRGKRLECDATVQYALGARKPRLLYKDLQIDSEYNTYLHAGLPPGPICNPGEASIKAAMAPAAVPYLYYVAKPDGSHVFSTTFAEHTAAIARIRQQAQGAAQ